MKKRTPVYKIMTKDLRTINITNNLRDAKRLFEENEIHHLPVTNGEQIIGMISKSDLSKFTFMNNYVGGKTDTSMFDIFKLEQVMSKNLTTIQAEETVKEAAEVLSENEFHALPVLEGDKLAGIITSRDLLKFLVDQY
jgi:CBS domain-containing protein